MGRDAGRTVAAILLVVLLTMAGCAEAGQEGRTAPSDSPTVRIDARSAVEALCRMLGRGTGGNGALDKAFGEAHDPLHEIVAAVETLSRSSAARLLEAKSVVEAALEREDTSPGFVRSVRVLKDRTIDALTLLGTTIRGC